MRLFALSGKRRMTGRFQGQIESALFALALQQTRDAK
jgi:hypothetical protein